MAGFIDWKCLSNGYLRKFFIPNHEDVTMNVQYFECIVGFLKQNGIKVYLANDINQLLTSGYLNVHYSELYHQCELISTHVTFGVFGSLFNTIGKPQGVFR